MVAKKKNLRAKAAVRLARAPDVDDVEPEQMVLPEDPKAFLHIPRESKKQKMATKSKSFLSKLHESTSLNGGISKSALRRRKRKMRDQLKPKMEDLLISLEQDGVKEALEVSSDDENGEIKKDVSGVRTTRKIPVSSGSIVVKKNQPSIRNQRGAKQLTNEESERFQTVLQSKQFQQDPFSALKEVIKMQKI